VNWEKLTAAILGFTCAMVLCGGFIYSAMRYVVKPPAAPQTAAEVRVSIPLDQVANQAALAAIVLRPGIHTVMYEGDTLTILTNRYGQEWPQEMIDEVLK
jgi:hypothetical protein